jgi:RhtB (resistance to homoserine/threonine) family protein
MLTLSTLLALASIHFAAVVTPGANFLLVTTNSLNYSRRTGVFSVFGVATGALTYVTTGFIGVAALVAQSTLLFTLIRIIGALYFVYMGVGLLRNKARTEADMRFNDGNHDLTRWQAYRSGLLTAFSNPAAMLYFVSLFTTFIPMNALLPEKLLMIALVVSITLTWYVVVAITFSDPRVRRFYFRFQRWLNVPFALLWFGLALKLAAG